MDRRSRSLTIVAHIASVSCLFAGLEGMVIVISEGPRFLAACPLKDECASGSGSGLPSSLQRALQN